MYLETRFWVAIFLALALYFIAGSIGSGWMFFLCAAVLSALVAAVAGPLLILNNTKISQEGPSKVNAGEPFVVKIEISCRREGWWKLFFSPRLLLLKQIWQAAATLERSGSIKRRIDGKDSSSYGISSDSGSLTRAAAESGQRFRAAISGIFNDSPAPKSTHRAYDALVEAVDSPVTIDLHFGGLRRGLHPFGTVVARTSYPAGLFWVETSFTSDKSITVYPSIYPMEGFFLYRIKALGSGTFGRPREGVTSQSVFTRSVRGYVRGDSPRSIHWMSTARMGRLMVREYEPESGVPQFDVSLDLSANWATFAQFELAVSTAASLIELGQRLGLDPRLHISPSPAELNFDLPAGLSLLEEQMEILARVQPVVTADGAVNTSISQIFPVATDRTLVMVCPQVEFATVIQEGDSINGEDQGADLASGSHCSAPEATSGLRFNDSALTAACVRDNTFVVEISNSVFPSGTHDMNRQVIRGNCAYISSIDDLACL